MLVLVAIAVLVPFSLIALRIASKQRQGALERSRAEQATTSRIGDLLAGFVDFKGFGYAGRLLNRIDEALRTHAIRAEEFERRESLLTDLSQAASLAATVGITIWGAQIVIDTSFTTGGLAACSVLGGRSVSTCLALFSSLVRFGAVRAANDQVLNLRQALGPAAAKPRVAANGDERDIELNAVAVHRAGADVPAVSCIIPAGSTVLLHADIPESEVLLMLAIADLAGQTKIVFAAGRGKTGKTTLLRWIVIVRVEFGQQPRHAAAGQEQFDHGIGVDFSAVARERCCDLGAARYRPSTPPSFWPLRPQIDVINRKSESGRCC
jgi:ABC-type protease/lipase transport system fused ATPase/permease subunit